MTETLERKNEVADWQEFLGAAGAFGDSAFGVQYDLNAAWRVTGDSTIGASFCDHNCTLMDGGNYTCLASKTLNIGVKPSTMVPSDIVLGSFGKITEGIESARTEYFGGPEFQAYCEDFRIPGAVAVAMETTWNTPGFEVNLFGGNPELNPGVTEVIRVLRNEGQMVHLTTTGGRFMRDAKFLDDIVEHPPTLIALSADDFDGPDDIRYLASLTQDELKAHWRKVPPQHGQRRKAHEAMYTARLAQETPGFPKLLFNMVLHNGNLSQANEIITELTGEFPDVTINPFPAQSAFSYDDPVLELGQADILRDFIDGMIETQTAAVREGTPSPFDPNLHYWLMLRSVYDLAGSDRAAALRMITGEGVWQCYRDSPAGFYMQAGLGPDGSVRKSDDQHAGGCMGCFWNKETVTVEQPLWSEEVTPRSISDYLQVGKKAIAAESSHPCPGCAFPRLVGHILSTESGMDPRLLPYYFERREEALGF